MNGTVVRLNSKKLFGFITGEDNKDYFFHKTDFNGHWMDLIEDMDKGNIIKVQFRNDKTPKGLRASTVIRTEHPDEPGYRLIE